MIRKFVIGSFVALSAVVVACGSSERRGFEEESARPGGGGGALGTPQADAAPAESEACEKMDILFVVDDSGTMKEEQANLAVNFPKFLDKIETFKTKSGSKLDWRIAVTTTGRDVKYNIATPIGSVPFDEKGDNGAFRMPEDCGTTKRWIEKTDANVESAFQCLALVGTKGPGLEMPLHATKLALTDRMADGTNTGFLREDALLALVILTDEDDCSREDNDFTIPSDDCQGWLSDVKPVADYKQMLDFVTKGAGRWATAVIAGPTACESGFGKASEAKRLKQFAALAGKNGTVSSICGGDLTSALETALDTFDAACQALPPAHLK